MVEPSAVNRVVVGSSPTLGEYIVLINPKIAELMTGHCFNKGSSLQASVTEVGRRVGLSF